MLSKHSGIISLSLSLSLSFPPTLPTCSLVPDAEIMYLVSELISELPGLQEGQYRVLISHTSLLSSLLSYCSVPRHRHKELNTLLQKITVRPPYSKSV
jgi:histidyl-tRNA synthetase